MYLQFPRLTEECCSIFTLRKLPKKFSENHPGGDACIDTKSGIQLMWPVDIPALSLKPQEKKKKKQKQKRAILFFASCILPEKKVVGFLIRQYL